MDCNETYFEAIQEKYWTIDRLHDLDNSKENECYVTEDGVLVMPNELYPLILETKYNPI